ncbi:MAG: GNAT family N-acetyltransferase, partial [Shinella sp.]
MHNTVIKLEPPALERPPMLTIRAARPGDLQQILDMITLLAECHGDIAKIAAVDLDRDLFGANPWITALVAEANGRLIGYALLVPTYRATEGLRGMDLHHLFVRA